MLEGVVRGDPCGHDPLPKPPDPDNETWMEFITRKSGDLADRLKPKRDNPASDKDGEASPDNVLGKKPRGR